jgi:hypothetical protein
MSGLLIENFFFAMLTYHVWLAPLALLAGLIKMFPLIIVTHISSSLFYVNYMAFKVWFAFNYSSKLLTHLLQIS